MYNKNEVFDFSRFGRLLGNEIMDLFRKDWLMIVVIAALYLFQILVSLIFKIYPNAPIQMNSVILCSIICAFLIPSQVYGHVNDRNRGVYYAELPASIFEKYLSMFIVCVIAAPFILRTFALGLQGLTVAFSAIGGPDGYLQYSLTGQDFDTYFKDLLIIIIMQSSFFLGNLLFKKNKLFFTIIGIIVMHIVIGIIFFAILAIIYEDPFEGVFVITSMDDIEMIEEIIWLKVFLSVYLIAIPLLLYILSFFKFKKIQYR